MEDPDGLRSGSRCPAHFPHCYWTLSGGPWALSAWNVSSWKIVILDCVLFCIHAILSFVDWLSTCVLSSLSFVCHLLNSTKETELSSAFCSLLNTLLDAFPRIQIFKKNFSFQCFFCSHFQWILPLARGVGNDITFMLIFFFFFYLFVFFFFCYFFWPLPRHMEVPRLGVESGL